MEPQKLEEHHHYEGRGIKLDFQEGPVKEVGVSGCQNEDVMEILLHRLTQLNKAFPCRENALAITNLEQSLMWLKRRTELREKQGVEGLNLPHKS
jgi:hypothetical protein